MTIRDKLSAMKRKASIVLCGGIALIGVSALFTEPGSSVPWFPLLAFLVTAIFYSYVVFWRIRCPKCKSRWGYVAMYEGGPFSVSKKIRFCPYCGVPIDSGLDKYTA